MSKNFLTRVSSVWQFSFYSLMTNFWVWVFYGIVQFFCFASAAFAIFLGLLGLIGFDARVVCQRFLEQISQKSHGVVVSYAFSEVFSWISSFPVALGLFLLGLGLVSYGFWLNFGVTIIARDLYFGLPVSLRRVFAIDWPVFFKVIGAMLLMIAVVVPAFFLFIVPGVFLMVRLIVVFPLLANDSSLGVFEVFKKSWQVTAHRWDRVLWFLIGCFFMNLIVGHFLRIFVMALLLPLARYALLYELQTEQTGQRAIDELVCS